MTLKICCNILQIVHCKTNFSCQIIFWKNSIFFRDKTICEKCGIVFFPAVFCLVCGFRKPVKGKLADAPLFKTSLMQALNIEQKEEEELDVKTHFFFLKKWEN